MWRLARLRRAGVASWLAMGTGSGRALRGSLGLLVQHLGDLGAQDRLVHFQLGRRRLQVHRALNGIGNRCDRRHHGPNHLGALQRVGARLVGEQLSFELQEVLRIVVDGAVQRVAANFLGVGVGIVAVGKENDLDRHAFRQQHVNAPKRGANPCGVAVKNDGDMLGVATDQVDLACGQGRPTGRHHVGHPGLVHRHHIGVAFHQEAALFLDNLSGLAKCMP